MKSDKPVMLTIAEKAATPKEIRGFLEVEARRYLSGDVQVGLRELIEHLHGWLNLREFARFSRKKTVEQVAARAVKHRRR